jgi:hypothetical protein
MTDFRRLSVAKRKQEEFQISEDTAGFALTRCASQTLWMT